MTKRTDAEPAAGPGPAPKGHAPVPGVPACFEDDFGWLLAQCFRAHIAAMDQALTDLPHGHRGFQALSGAVHRSARNQAELAKQLGVDRTVMVYLIDDLERAGLVERVADPADRRSKLIEATVAGRERLAATESAISAAESELLGALSAEDRRRLRSMLREIASRASLGGGSPCEAAARCAAADGDAGRTGPGAA
jgi:MarR family transcriptional regulator, transcriptional regulator for hemolysin